MKWVRMPFPHGSLRLLARAARGSMRDALSLTDQAIAFGSGSLSEDGVRQMLGTVDRSHVIAILDALIAAGNGIDDGFRIGGAVLLRKAIVAGLVVKPAIDAAQATPFDEALQRLVDGVAVGEIEEIARRPDSAWHTTINAIEDLRFEAGRQAVHVRNL